MTGSWGDIPPPPGFDPKRTPHEVKFEIIANSADLEGKVSKTLGLLPLHLRKGFLESVLDLVRSGACRAVYVRLGKRSFVQGADGATTYALIRRIYSAQLVGLDELCATALRAAGIESGN